MQADGKLTKKLAGGILVIVLLALCLCVTTVALVWESVAVKNTCFKPVRFRSISTTASR